MIRKNITFETLKISTFEKTRENPPRNQRNFHCVEFDKLNAMEIALNFEGVFYWRYIP